MSWFDKDQVTPSPAAWYDVAHHINHAINGEENMIEDDPDAEYFDFVGKTILALIVIVVSMIYIMRFQFSKTLVLTTYKLARSFVTAIYEQIRILFMGGETPTGGNAPTLNGHCWNSEENFYGVLFCSHCGQTVKGSSWWTQRMAYTCGICGRASHQWCRRQADRLPCKHPCASDRSHHFVEGNLPPSSICEVCGLSCASMMGLTGMRCMWCDRTVHDSCSKAMLPDCDYGIHRDLVLPPTAVCPIIKKPESDKEEEKEKERRKSVDGLPKSRMQQMQEAGRELLNKAMATYSGAGKKKEEEEEEKKDLEPIREGTDENKDDKNEQSQSQGTLKEETAESKSITAQQTPKPAAATAQPIEAEPEETVQTVEANEPDNAAGPKKKQKRKSEVSTPPPIKTHGPAFSISSSSTAKPGIKPAFDKAPEKKHSSPSFAFATPMSPEEHQNSSDTFNTQSRSSLEHESSEATIIDPEQERMMATCKSTQGAKYGSDPAAEINGLIDDTTQTHSSPRHRTMPSTGSSEPSPNNSPISKKTVSISNSTGGRPLFHSSSSPVVDSLARWKAPRDRVNSLDGDIDQFVMNVESPRQAKAVMQPDSDSDPDIDDRSPTSPQKSNSIRHPSTPDRPTKTTSPLDIVRQCSRRYSDPAITGFHSPQPAPQELDGLDGQPLENLKLDTSALKRTTSQDMPDAEKQAQMIPWTTANMDQFEIHADKVKHTVLLVFVNPKSGGQLGSTLMERFRRYLNPLQVVDLSKDTPQKALEVFRPVAEEESLVVTVCGGDGSAGWIMDTIAECYPNLHVPLGILPLGTGNDLANVLGWGQGYTLEDDLSKYLTRIHTSTTSMFDRWKIDFTKITAPKPSGEGDKKKSVPNVETRSWLMNNYMDLGCVAKIVDKFHNVREGNPELFKSRIGNKFRYAELSFEDMMDASKAADCSRVTIYCDGKQVRPPRDAASLVVINIPSFSGGANLWPDLNDTLVGNFHPMMSLAPISQTTDHIPTRSALSPKNRPMFAQAFQSANDTNFHRARAHSPSYRSPNAPGRPNLPWNEDEFGREHLEGLGSAPTLRNVHQPWKKQSFKDGIIEVVSVRSLFHMAQITIGVALPERICQGKEIKILLPEAGKMPLQVDGEPAQISGPGMITVQCAAQSLVLLPTHVPNVPRGCLHMNQITEMINDMAERQTIDRRTRKALLRELARRAT